MRKALGSALLVAVLAAAYADPRIGDSWHSFHLTDAGLGNADWTPGRVTVVSFCAYWCDTWRQQVPRLVAAKNATTGLPVDFLTVSVDGRWSEVAQNNGGLPLWLDKGGEWSRGKGVDRVPTTVVLDPAGEVRYVSGGVVRTDELVQAVRAAKGHKPEAGVLYLTFDDFPPANGGEELLDELRALGVKATLFCLGSRVEASASLLKRALAEGHSLQIHSWDHHATDPQLEQCRTTFKRVLGVEPTLYRAPGSEVIVGDERHHRIVDPFDYSRPSRKELLRRILPAVCSEAVIQLHAGVSVTREALSELVEDLRKRGFRFGTLSQNGL